MKTDAPDRSVRKVLRQIKAETFKVIFLNAFLNTIIVFLISQMLFMLVGLEYYFAVAVALIFFVVNFIENRRKMGLRKIEEKNPSLNEILRTARDNINSKNILALSLFEDVLLKVKEFTTGNLLSYKAVFFKILAISLLGIMLIFTGVLNLEITKLKIPVDKIKNKIYDQFIKLPEFEFSKDEKIYGDPRLIELNDPELFLKLTPQVSEVTFDKIRDEEEIYFDTQTFPVEVSAIQDMPNEEKKPFESRLAKEYNLKLKELI